MKEVQEIEMEIYKLLYSSKIVKKSVAQESSKE